MRFLEGVVGDCHLFWGKRDFERGVLSWRGLRHGKGKGLLL